MKTIIVIPARYNSSRFPGKPLKIIKGYSLLYRVWCIAKSVKHIDEVYIATDHADIQSHAMSFGAKVIMTNACENGTMRVFDAMRKLGKKPDIVFNLQADAVLTPPWVIQALVDTMLANSTIAMTTPATQITRDQYASMHENKLKGEVGGTLVVCDKNGNALYFSKNMIPYLRDTKMKNPPLYRHIGLYAYRYTTLEKYTTLAPTPLEILEGLEQLRLLENGVTIRVVIVDYKGRTHGSVDCVDDIERVESIIDREGELVMFS